MVFSLMVTANHKTMEIAQVLNSMVDFSKSAGIESLEKSIVFLKNEPLLQLDFLSAILALNQTSHSKEKLVYLITFSLNVLRKKFRNTRPRILTKSLYLLSKVNSKRLTRDFRLGPGVGFHIPCKQKFERIPAVFVLGTEGAVVVGRLQPIETFFQVRRRVQASIGQRFLLGNSIFGV